MSKRERNADARESRGSRQPDQAPFVSPGLVGILTLVGVAVLIFMNVKLWGETGKSQEAISQLDARIAALGSKVEAAARAAATPPRQGPDPNKVYQVKSAGAPAKGPENAPITIAEFSDFQ